MRYPLLVAVLVSGLAAACANHAKRSVDLYEHGDYAAAARAADEDLTAHPGDDGLWAMRVRSALALGDGEGIAKAYAGYIKERGDDDKPLARDLAVATIEQALASPSVRIKVRAIDAVAQLEIQDLADDVARKMTENDDRVSAAAAIAVLNAYPTAPQTAYELMKSENAEARRIVIDGIGKKVGKLALPDLERAASDPDPDVRVAALRWIGQLRDPDGVAICTKLLADHRSIVRAAAATALAHIGLGNLAELGQRAVGDKMLSVRLAGVDLLAAAHREDLLAKLADDPEPLVALAAAIAAKPARSDLAGKAIERAIAAEDPAKRAGAANYLVAALGKPGALPIAKKLTGDADASVRLAAARVLAHAGDREGAIEVFAAALGGDHGVQAAADLAELGDARGIDALAKLTRDPALPVEERIEAVNAHRSAHRITAGLVAALADPTGAVRIEAAAVLAALAR